MNDTITISTKLDGSGFENGSNALRSAIKSISATVDKFGNAVKNSFSKIAGSFKSLKTQSQSFGNSINVAMKSLLRVAPSLLGIGSIFASLTKAVSAFMSQNQQLTANLQAAWQGLGNALGPIITQVVTWVTTAVSYFLSFLQLLGLANANVKNTGQTAASAGQAANNAAKELKRTLAGFDELNVLQDNSTGNSVAAGSSPGIQGSLPDVDLPDWLKEMAELLKNGEFGKAGELLGDLLNKMVDDTDWAGIGQKMSNAFRGCLDFLYRAIKKFDFEALGKKIREMLINIDWHGIFTDVANLVAEMAKAPFEFLWGVINGDETDKPPKIIKAIDDVKNSILGFRDQMEPVIKSIWDDVLKPFLNWTMESALPGILDSIKDAITRIGNAISTHWGDIKKFWDECLKPKAEWIGEKAVNLIKQLFDAIADVIEVLSGEMSFSEFVSQMSKLENVVAGAAIGSMLLKIAEGIGAIIGVLKLFTGIKEAKTLFSSIQEASDTIIKGADAAKTAADGAAVAAEGLGAATSTAGSSMLATAGTFSLYAGLAYMVGRSIVDLVNDSKAFDEAMSYQYQTMEEANAAVESLTKQYEAAQQAASNLAMYGTERPFYASPSQNLCKPPRRCRIGAPSRRLNYDKEKSYTGRKRTESKNPRVAADRRHQQHGRHPESIQGNDC